MPDAASTLYVSWNMEFKDYYSILGVEQGASDDDIRKAYRKLARKYHPDVSKESDAEARMRDVNEAYDVLRDKEKREAYDNLAAGVSPGGGFQPTATPVIRTASGGSRDDGLGDLSTTQRPSPSGDMPWMHRCHAWSTRSMRCQ